MNETTGGERSGLAYMLGILGAFLIIGALAWYVHRSVQPSPLGALRAQERAKALAEMRAAEHEAVNTTAWLDQPKGIVRLRVEDAMKLVLADWGANPAAARSNLIQRVEKATAVPPKAPEKPSAFE